MLICGFFCKGLLKIVDFVKFMVIKLLNRLSDIVVMVFVMVKFRFKVFVVIENIVGFIKGEVS